MATTFDVLGIF